MSQTAALTREAASILVRDAERKTGSRMTAYETVGRSIGTSAGWLRKFIAGREAKEPGLSTGLKILNQYSRFCDRVGAEIENEKAKALALKRQVDAIGEIIDRAVASTAREESIGAAAPDAE